MTSNQVVPRPLKSLEYQIEFGSREAEKGWRDLLATARNSAVDAWDYLTKTPCEMNDRCYQLRGDRSLVKFEGAYWPRWQYKPTSGGRIWYVVVPKDPKSKKPGRVILERVMTGHPVETVKQFR